MIHPRQLFPQHPPSSSTTFWLDPEGLGREAVYVREEESPASGAYLSRSQPLEEGMERSLGGLAGPERWPAEAPPAGPRQGTLATRPTALLGSCWADRSSAGAGAGAAVSKAYASALRALKNASFQCIPSRP